MSRRTRALFLALSFAIARSASANTLSVGSAASSLTVEGASCAYYRGIASNGCDVPNPTGNLVPGIVTTSLLTATVDDTSHLFTTGYSSYMVASAEATGRMKIYGAPNPLTGGVDPANAIGPGYLYAATSVLDTITFSGPTASDGLYHFTLNLQLHGLFTDALPGTSGSFPINDPVLTLNLFPTGAASCLSSNSSFASMNSPINYTLSVSCATPGQVVFNAGFGFYMQNARADFASTAAVYFDPLPQGVSITSASGAFLNTPLPEPDSLALVLFAAAVVAGCEGRKSRQESRRG